MPQQTTNPPAPPTPREQAVALLAVAFKKPALLASHLDKELLHDVTGFVKAVTANSDHYRYFKSPEGHALFNGIIDQYLRTTDLYRTPGAFMHHSYPEFAAKAECYGTHHPAPAKGQVQAAAHCQQEAVKTISAVLTPVMVNRHCAETVKDVEILIKGRTRDVPAATFFHTRAGQALFKKTLMEYLGVPQANSHYYLSDAERHYHAQPKPEKRVHTGKVVSLYRNDPEPNATKGQGRA